MASLSLDDLVARWTTASAAERANKDHFLIDLCDALGVERPAPTTSTDFQDNYVFEKDAPTTIEGGSSVRKIDLYRDGHFILEAKQGSGAGAQKKGTAKRDTPGWAVAMNDAYGQAIGYAKSFEQAVPFIVVCDIGYCFDLYSCFSGDWQYRQFPNGQQYRIFLKDLPSRPDLVERLRKVWTDPWDLDPSRHAAKATTTVAAPIAKLAERLERSGHDPQIVAQFLMRCLFTMFSEGIGLLPDRVFTNALKDYWVPSPASFPGGIESLWRTMNEGGHTFGIAGRILKFSDGLFKNPVGLPLDRGALEILLEAAERDWSAVEPAIFGTLLEQALSAKERHALGAHYTPRAYVERLVRPTIEEPLREEWDQVRIEVRTLLKGIDDQTGQTRTKTLNRAAQLVQGFHKRLLALRILDPACGTGNFLYVAMDILKRLESEVLALLASIEGGDQGLLHMESARISPEQFLGIEIKHWAKEIAELVLWIGYLQWHFRQHGKTVQVAEPVLRDYHNIECRDAVLAYDCKELARDETGKPITVWDGVSTKQHPVTGEQVPDESKRMETWRYTNPRKAEWPKADFIVGNPPFIGNKRMRSALGNSYVEALRTAWSDVPESADFVMYWWNYAANCVEQGKARQFGLITTNSITQAFNKRVVEEHLQRNGSLVYSVPDHPWVDSTDGAQVRIAMTVFSHTTEDPRLEEVVSEDIVDGDDTHRLQLLVRHGRINSDLSVGIDLAALRKLSSNRGLSCPGVQLSGQGFVVVPEERNRFSARTTTALVRPYVTGRDLSQRRREQYVIDTFGLSEGNLRERYPDAYQWLIERVKPERDQNPRASYRKNWWLHSEPRSKFRAALGGLERFVGTSRTARHRVFQFLPATTLPETKVLVIALADGVSMAVLSSRVHVVFANATGGWLGVGNDSTYNHSSCFDPFPFPAFATAEAGNRAAAVAEALDAHRKVRQSEYPELTITGMYNVLEKLRSGEPLTAKERVIHEQGLVSVLKQLHDDLDAAVFDAYGWPHDLTDEQILERLVALNAERAREEAQGLIRWLRPDFQNPTGKQAHQGSLEVAEDDDDEPADEDTVTSAAVAWPKKLPEQIRAVQGAVQSGTTWTAQALSRSFKGSKVEQVQDILESLGALGMLIQIEQAGDIAWSRPVPATIARTGGSTRPPSAA